MDNTPRLFRDAPPLLFNRGDCYFKQYMQEDADIICLQQVGSSDGIQRFELFMKGADPEQRYVYEIQPSKHSTTGEPFWWLNGH